MTADTKALAPIKQVRHWMTDDKVRKSVADILPSDINCDAFIGQCLIALQTDDLQKCSPQSQFQAIFTCATLGLLPTIKQVAMIPRAGKVDVMPQWQGYKALMERHPSILELTPYLVHKTDSYSFENGVMVHKYDPFNESRSIESIKDIVGGYVKIEYTDGRTPKFFTCTAQYIEKCAKCAQTNKVWSVWFEQQALKTLIRACYARRAVPLDPFAEKALKILSEKEDEMLGNDPSRPVVMRRPESVEQFKRRQRESRPAEVIDESVYTDEPSQTPEPPQKAPESPQTHAEAESEPTGEEGPPTPHEAAMAYIARINRRRTKSGIDEDLEAAMKEIHSLPADSDEKTAAQRLVVEAADRRTEEISGKDTGGLFPPE